MISPMKNLIDRLLRESRDAMTAAAVPHPLMPHGALNGFLECQLVLKGGYAVAGVLTTTAEGTLRMLAPAQKSNGDTLMADHYFDYDDVLTIVIGRDLPVATHPRPVSSIILG